MKNKVELMKTIRNSIFVILIISGIFAVFQCYQYKVYTITFNHKISSIITKINERYPDVDKDEIIELLNSRENIDEDLFRSYGIELEKETVVVENDQYFIQFFVWNLIILIGGTGITLSLFLRYNKNKDKKLNEITKYIEEINNKNYKLDIDDNSEDELSILKNEIYKITVMLKEVAENSMKDKNNLKDSLSDISHQLKTPLTSISILLDNILDNPEMDNKTRNEFVTDIKREVLSINFLVNSLLKLSKLDANSVNFMKKENPIKSIVDEAVKNVSVLCDLKNMEITISGDKNIKIICDFKWQVEAMTNILKNCIEHSNENSKIEINYEKNQLYSKITIRDYGIRN